MNEVLSKNQNSKREKFLLIPCISAGMGSVLQGAVAGLLFAELTGRVPYVYWHTNCKYLKSNASTNHNAFLDYFCEISRYDLNDLFRLSERVFPNCSGCHELHDVIDDYHGRLREQVLHFENMCSEEVQEADLVIFPAYIGVDLVMTHIDEGHAFYGLSAEEITERVSQENLIVRPEIIERVDEFWHSHFAGTEQIVTVHIRGGDKYQDSILPAFSRYKDEVDDYLLKYPDAEMVV